MSRIYFVFLILIPVASSHAQAAPSWKIHFYQSEKPIALSAARLAELEKILDPQQREQTQEAEIEKKAIELCSESIAKSSQFNRGPVVRAIAHLEKSEDWVIRSVECFSDGEAETKRSKVSETPASESGSGLDSESGLQSDGVDFTQVLPHDVIRSFVRKEIGDSTLGSSTLRSLGRTSRRMRSIVHGIKAEVLDLTYFDLAKQWDFRALFSPASPYSQIKTVVISEFVDPRVFEFLPKTVETIQFSSFPGNIHTFTEGNNHFVRANKALDISKLLKLLTEESFLPNLKRIRGWMACEFSGEQYKYRMGEGQKVLSREFLRVLAKHYSSLEELPTFLLRPLPHDFDEFLRTLSKFTHLKKFKVYGEAYGDSSRFIRVLKVISRLKTLDALESDTNDSIIFALKNLPASARANLKTVRVFLKGKLEDREILDLLPNLEVVELNPVYINPTTNENVTKILLKPWKKVFWHTTDQVRGKEGSENSAIEEWDLLYPVTLRELDGRMPPPLPRSQFLKKAKVIKLVLPVSVKQILANMELFYSERLEEFSVFLKCSMDDQGKVLTERLKTFCVEIQKAFPNLKKLHIAAPFWPGIVEQIDSACPSMPFEIGFIQAPEHYLKEL